MIEPNMVVGFLVGVITIITAVAGLFKYKWNQALSSAKYKFITNADIDKLAQRIDDLCKKLENMRKDMQDEIISAKEEHASMQIKYQELVKELYKLIGQVTTLVNKK